MQTAQVPKLVGNAKILPKSSNVCLQQHHRQQTTDNRRTTYAMANVCNIQLKSKRSSRPRLVTDLLSREINQIG